MHIDPARQTDRFQKFAKSVVGLTQLCGLRMRWQDIGHLIQLEQC